MSETWRLSESATVRVSSDELLVIREKAARANLSIGGYFRAAGGEKFAAIPCLNDSAAGVRVIQNLVQRELSGWL